MKFHLCLKDEAVVTKLAIKKHEQFLSKVSSVNFCSDFYVDKRVMLTQTATNQVIRYSGMKICPGMRFGQQGI